MALSYPISPTTDMDDYLAAEASAQERHEYCYGKVYAMAGSTVRHNSIIMNIVLALLGEARAKSCALYTENIKLKIANKAVYYPDVIIHCPPANPNASLIEHPCVLIEVLSASTDRKDEIEKYLMYRDIPSLQLYLLVDSRKPQIRGHYRMEQGWQERYFTEDDSIPIPCLDVTTSYQKLYQTVFS